MHFLDGTRCLLDGMKVFQDKAERKVALVDDPHPVVHGPDRPVRLAIYAHGG